MLYGASRTAFSSSKSVSLSSLGPGERFLEPVVPPKQFIAYRERRRAGQPTHHRLFVLRAQSLLSLRRTGCCEHPLCIHIEAAENCPKRRLSADVLLCGVVRRKDHPRKSSRPAFLLAHKRKARCFQPVLRKANRWQFERQPLCLTNALQVAPHIAPLLRENVEWGIVPTIRLENRPHQ